MEPALIEKAAFLRLGVALGLVSTREAIRFADQVITQSDDPSASVLDLSTTDPTAHLAVIDALSTVIGLPLSAPPSHPTVHALLDVIREDVVAGRRDLPDAIVLIDRLSHFLANEDNFRWELAALADDYALVQQDVTGDLPTIAAIVHDFLAQFDGASAAFRGRDA
jgi:hypothetical protein